MDTVTQLLRRYQRHPSQTLVGEIFAHLAQAQVYVPVDLGKNPDAALQQAFGLKPDTIPGPGGKVLFPAFTSQHINPYSSDEISHLEKEISHLPRSPEDGS